MLMIGSNICLRLATCIQRRLEYSVERGSFRYPLVIVLNISLSSASSSYGRYWK